MREGYKNVEGYILFLPGCRKSEGKSGAHIEEKP